MNNLLTHACRAGLLISLLSGFMLSCQRIVPTKPPLNVAAGTVDRLESFPSRHVSPRHVEVWLPEGYPARGMRYPVLYMHDGQMLFDSATTWNGQEWSVDEVVAGLIAGQRIRPCIVVGVWNSGTGRHSDYFPQKPFLELPQAFRDSLLQQVNRSEAQPLFDGPVRSDAYLRFLVGELKPYIDRHYATLPDPANTFVAGSSMGGLISMYALCEYPNVFGGAACLSTHWPGIFAQSGNPIPETFIRYLEANLPSPATHRLYFDYGTATLDAWYEPYQLQADEVMRKKGYGPSQWKTLRFEGEDHSERAWQKRLHLPLTFLMGAQQAGAKQ